MQSGFESSLEGGEADVVLWEGVPEDGGCNRESSALRDCEEVGVRGAGGGRRGVGVGGH